MESSHPGNMKKQPLTYGPKKKKKKTSEVTQVRISKCSVLEVLEL